LAAVFSNDGEVEISNMARTTALSAVLSEGMAAAASRLVPVNVGADVYRGHPSAHRPPQRAGSSAGECDRPAGNVLPTFRDQTG
jgi:hypothetical protein